jgi:hypothetical protein
VRDSAARCAYFDLQSTVAAIRHGGGGAPSGPPDGYCLVVASDRSTWPPGFDPRDERTWDGVAWWEGATRDDSSTWYYDCGRSGVKKSGAAAGAEAVSPAAIPHEFTLAPVASYGTGIRVGTKEAGLELIGPVGVVPESAGLGGGQTGEGLVLLRTEPVSGVLRLGATLVTTESTIRLVARDDADVAVVTSLGAGDVLAVTGRDSAGHVRTALVSLREAPHAVASVTPSVAGGPAVFRFFEAATDAPDATYLGYLSNTVETASGAEFLADAAVALVARDGAVVTYYATRDESGGGLVRAVGNPFAPSAVERLVGGLASGLTVQVEPSGRDAGPPTLVRIMAPVLAADEGSTAEPVEAEVALLNAVSGRGPVTVVWDAIGTESTGGGQ